MEFKQEGYSDPKNTYLIKLINMLDVAAWSLAVKPPEPYKTLRVLAALLASIQVVEADKKYALVASLQDLAVHNYDRFMSEPTTNEVREIYFEICTYMNETYFKDFKGFHFQNPKGGSFGKRD